MSLDTFRYTSVLIDWDGTVQHTLSVWSTACTDQLSNRGITRDLLTVARDIVPHLHECTKHGVMDVEAFIQGVVVQALPLLSQAEFNRDIWEVIETLQSYGVQQAVVSSSSLGAITDALTYHKKDLNVFSHLVTRDSLSETKPNPAPLLYALKILNATKKQTLMIGDSGADIAAGKAAGIDTVWLYPPENELYYDAEEMRALDPTYIAYCGADILRIVTEGKME
ncbi:MAG: HAD-IA family hydrolase [Candidatus Woesebacteria bacterium]